MVKLGVCVYDVDVGAQSHSDADDDGTVVGTSVGAGFGVPDAAGTTFRQWVSFLPSSLYDNSRVNDKKDIRLVAYFLREAG